MPEWVLLRRACPKMGFPSQMSSTFRHFFKRACQFLIAYLLLISGYVWMIYSQASVSQDRFPSKMSSTFRHFSKRDVNSWLHSRLLWVSTYNECPSQNISLSWDKMILKVAAFHDSEICPNILLALPVKWRRRHAGFVIFIAKLVCGFVRVVFPMLSACSIIGLS